MSSHVSATSTPSDTNAFATNTSATNISTTTNVTTEWIGARRFVSFTESGHPPYIDESRLMSISSEITLSQVTRT